MDTIQMKKCVCVCVCVETSELICCIVLRRDLLPAHVLGRVHVATAATQQRQDSSTPTTMALPPDSTPPITAKRKTDDISKLHYS